jgi:hypothetical protein
MTEAQLAIDLIDEAHNEVVLRSAKYQQDLRHYHNRQIVQCRRPSVAKGDDHQR